MGNRCLEEVIRMQDTDDLCLAEPGQCRALDLFFQYGSTRKNQWDYVKNISR